MSYVVIRWVNKISFTNIGKYLSEPLPVMINWIYLPAKTAKSDLATDLSLYFRLFNTIICFIRKVRTPRNLIFLWISSKVIHYKNKCKPNIFRILVVVLGWSVQTMTCRVAVQQTSQRPRKKLCIFQPSPNHDPQRCLSSDHLENVSDNPCECQN